MESEIIKPLAFSAVSGSSVDYPIANLASDRRGLVWRTAGVSGAQHFIIDLGEAKSVDRVALLRTNLRDTATWQVRAGSTSGGTSSSPTHDSGSMAAWASSTLRRERPNSFYKLTSAHSARYWRIDITDTSHPDGYIEACRLVIGTAFKPANGISYGSGRGIEDFSVIRRTPKGDPSILPGRRYPTASLRLDWIEDSEYEAFLSFLEESGTSTPLLFHLDTDDATDGMAKMYYGPISRSVPLVYEGYDINSILLDVTTVI